MAIGCNASPTSATRPVVRKSRGGGQSYRSRHLTSVSAGMRCASLRKGSAQVSASRRSSVSPSASVSGKGSGVSWPKKPARTGHETTIWQAYLPPLAFPSGALRGASRTSSSSQHPALEYSQEARSGQTHC